MAIIKGLGKESTKVQFKGDSQDAQRAAEGNTAAARYDHLQTDREPFYLRAVDCSKLTIPYLFPPKGHNASTILPTPYQGTGARGVNNLAAKMQLALFPPNAPFFRYQIDDFTAQKIAGDPNLKSLIEKGLASVERAVMTKFQVEHIRTEAFEALKQLIVTGNVLVYLKDTGGLKVFRLDRYVVRRDTMGRLLEIIAKEDVDRSTLTVEQQKVFGGLGDTDPETSNHDQDTCLYTWIKLNRKTKLWEFHQEIDGRTVPGTEGTYPEDKSPWMPLRWTKVDNEDYGRGYVEEYLGDIKSLEGLTKAIVEGAAAAAKVLFLVNPNGTTNARQITEAPNGAVRAGNAADVTVLQMEKQADFQVAERVMDQITQRLAFAFLLNTSVQRNGERVTAEEIRFMAGELEDALGGIYSVLTEEFQLPLVVRAVFEMERKGELPKLPHQLMRPTITTGMEALGRGQDLTRLQQFMQALNGMGPQVAQQIAQYLNVPDLITRVGTSLSIDTDGLIKSDQQVQQEMAQQQQMQMAQNVAPHIVKGISDNLKQHTANQGAAQQQQQGQPPNG